MKSQFRSLYSGLLVGSLAVGYLPSGNLVYAESPVQATTSVLSLSNQNQRQAIRGVVSAVQTADLAVDFSARINKVHRRTGDAFETGDTLISFDCTTQSAQLNAARASYQARSIEHRNLVEMQKSNAAGEHEVTLAKAEKDQAAAGVEELQIRLSRCDIKAPYNGRVAELTANGHETVSANKPFMRIVNSDEMELRLIIPSAWLKWLKTGETFEFTIDETGQVHQAVVNRIGAEVDAVSRTVPIFAHIQGGEAALILPGMSGSARFDAPAQ